MPVIRTSEDTVNFMCAAKSVSVSLFCCCCCMYDISNQPNNNQKERSCETMMKLKKELKHTRRDTIQLQQIRLKVNVTTFYNT